MFLIFSLALSHTRFDTGAFTDSAKFRQLCVWWSGNKMLECFFHWHIAQNNMQHAEYLVLCMLHVSHYCTPNSNQRLQWLFSGTYCTLYFIDTLYFCLAAIQSTIIWAWCLHLDNLTNLTNTSWSKLFSFIFLSFMLLLQTIHWWSSVLFSFAFFMQTLLTAISMSAIATNGVVPGT